MKHIKRKFLLTHNITQDGYQFLVGQMDKPITQKKAKNTNVVPHIISTEKEFIQAFFYELNGQKIPIPEPNPIVIYFSNAQGFLSVILEKRIELFEELKLPNYDIDNVLNHMFAFYGCVVNFASSLFDALEAFTNSKIPKDYKCPNPDRRKDIMNKYKIIRYCNFETKVKRILPDIYNGKNFVVSKSHLYEHIKLLNNLRDNITHAKSDMEYEINYYERLFIETLNFDYLKTIESAKEFINFYDDNLIEPCNCGLNH